MSINMTDIATTSAGGAVAALQSLRTGLANVQQAIPLRSGEPYLRLDKSGMWIYGADDIEVEEGSLWAVNPLSFRHGWAAWTRYPVESKKKNVLVKEMMVAMNVAKGTKPAPAFHDGEDWEFADQVSCLLVCTNGEDKGEQVLYKTTSVGGLNAMAKLTADIMAQLDRDPSKIMPYVELLSDSYKHQTFGKVMIPILTVRQWAALDPNMPEDIAVEETAKTGQPAETVKETPKTEEPKANPAPEGRRRRAAASTESADTQAAQQEPAPAQAEAPATEPARRRRRVA